MLLVSSHFVTRCSPPLVTLSPVTGLLDAGPGGPPPGQSLLVISFKPGEWRFGEGRARNDDQVCTRRRLVTPEHLSNQSLSVIPLHGPAQFFRGRDAQPRHRQLGPQKKNRHIAPLQPSALLIDPLEVDPSPDVFGADHRLPPLD